MSRLLFLIHLRPANHACGGSRCPHSVVAITLYCALPACPTELDLETEWAGEDIVVFIDTNPAFTEYTQLALCE